MKHLLLSFLLLISFAVFAQKPTNKSESIKGEIFGQLKDSLSNQPLEYAAISIYDLKSKILVSGGISNLSGKFNITDVPVGSYYVTIQFVGYDLKTIKPVNITKQNTAYNLNTVLMVADNALDEIVLDGSTPTIKYDIDKKIIDVSHLEVDLGQSATEVLENVPSITVDMDGTVNLRGSSSFTLLINGRPTAMDASVALATIPASSIKNIEIITNPSAKYEAEGVSGIMNIITKTNKLEGVSLLANGSAGSYDNYSGDVSVNVRAKETEFNLGFDYRNRSRPTDKTSNRYTDFDTTSTRVLSEGETDWGSENYGVNAEFSWQPNTAHTFTVGSRYNRRKMNSLNDLKFKEYTDDVEVYNYRNIGDALYDITSTSSYLNYRLNFNRNQEHYLEFRGVYNYRNGDDLVYQDYLDDSNIKTGGTKNTEVGPSNMFRFNVDYSQVFKNKMTFEAGVQTQFGESDEENNNYEYNPITREYEFQPQYSAKANYLRNISGIYSLVKGKRNKLGYQIGLRAEYTDRTISSDGLAKNTVVNRLDWFPTLHFSYQLPKEHQLLVNYTRRIQRPRSWYLEPFQTWENAYAIYQGNPDLNPEYVDAFEINWIKSISSKGSISVETYARFVENYINRVQLPYDTNVVLTTPLNVGSTVSIGIEPTFTYKVFDWWKVDLGFNFFNYEINSKHDQLRSSSNFNWNSRLTNTFPLKGNWNVQIASRYIGGGNTIQGRKEGYFTANGSLRKSFNKNQFALIFQMRDIFSTIRNESYTLAGNVRTENLSIPRTPTFSIGFSMRLNNYNKRITQDNSDDF